jgi:hypothetical protein
MVVPEEHNPMMHCWGWKIHVNIPIRARFHGRLELEVRVQLPIQHASFKNKITGTRGARDHFLVSQLCASTGIRSVIFHSARLLTSDSLWF